MSIQIKVESTYTLLISALFQCKMFADPLRGPDFSKN